MDADEVGFDFEWHLYFQSDKLGRLKNDIGEFDPSYNGYSSLPMRKVTVEVNAITDLVTNLGGVWKLITVIAGMILIPLLRYAFYDQLARHLIRKEDFTNG